MTTNPLTPERPYTNGNGNAAKLTLTVRDVVVMLIYTAIVAGAFFALQAKVAAISDSQQDMKQDIRELRQWIEKHP